MHTKFIFLVRDKQLNRQVEFSRFLSSKNFDSKDVLDLKFVDKSHKIQIYSYSIPLRYDRITKKPFLIGCKKIVLANGTSDLANRLGVRGENKSLSWLKYELPSLENAIKNVKSEEKVNSKPVLIVGAGLSAADAVIACRNSGIKVIHVFRSLTGGFVSFLLSYICRNLARGKFHRCNFSFSDELTSSIFPRI